MAKSEVVGVESTSEYMARKGIEKGGQIGDGGRSAVGVETTTAYMARKGIKAGEPLVVSPDQVRTVETQLEYLARKEAEQQAETKKAPAKSKKADD